MFWGLPRLCAVVSVRILGRFDTESADRNVSKSGPPVARYITHNLGICRYTTLLVDRIIARVGPPG